MMTPKPSRIHELGRMDRPALMSLLDELTGDDRAVGTAMPFWTNEKIIDRIVSLERGEES
jgi:hypothetical protein